MNTDLFAKDGPLFGWQTLISEATGSRPFGQSVRLRQFKQEVELAVRTMSPDGAGRAGPPYLHGAWIEADQDTDQIRDEIAAMLARSPIEDAEEHAIHDYEGFEGVSISEYAR